MLDEAAYFLLGNIKIYRDPNGGLPLVIIQIGSKPAPVDADADGGLAAVRVGDGCARRFRLTLVIVLGQCTRTEQTGDHDRDQKN